jgi:hypothetical protein
VANPHKPFSATTTTPAIIGIVIGDMVVRCRIVMEFNICEGRRKSN